MGDGGKEQGVVGVRAEWEIQSTSQELLELPLLTPRHQSGLPPTGLTQDTTGLFSAFALWCFVIAAVCSQYING